MLTAPSATHAWPPGHQLAHYRIVEIIGEGGMGIVYLADDEARGRQVALKVLHTDIASNPTKRKRFVREGKFLNALTHPSIAQVYEVGEADNRVFIAMEYVRGTTLKDVIATRGRLGVERTLNTITEIASALAEAHGSGIVHRDLKPDNIMIRDDEAKLLDFGIAKAADTAPVIGDSTATELTTRGQLLGTPAYMSPEQAKGLDVDQRSDVFSLGIVIYEMLTGRRPFQGETWQELIIAVNRDHPEPVTKYDPSVPPELEKVLMRCLEKSAEQRYKSCVELAADLDSIRIAHRRAKASARPPAVVEEPAVESARLPGLPPVGGVSATVPATARRPGGLFARHPWLVVAIVFLSLAMLTIGGMVLILRSGR